MKGSIDDKNSSASCTPRFRGRTRTLFRTNMLLSCISSSVIQCCSSDSAQCHPGRMLGNCPVLAWPSGQVPPHVRLPHSRLAARAASSSQLVFVRVDHLRAENALAPGRFHHGGASADVAVHADAQEAKPCEKESCSAHGARCNYEGFKCSLTELGTAQTSLNDSNLIKRQQQAILAISQNFSVPVYKRRPVWGPVVSTTVSRRATAPPEPSSM